MKMEQTGNELALVWDAGIVDNGFSHCATMLAPTPYHLFHKLEA